MRGDGSIHNNGHAGSVGEEVEIDACEMWRRRWEAEKARIVRAEKNGGAGEEATVARVNLTTTIILHHDHHINSRATGKIQSPEPGSPKSMR